MKLASNGKFVVIPGGGGGGVPAGVIVIWSGTASDIPSGWALCDGQNGTPDLRDRFVLGGGGMHTVGDSGGEETHTLTVAEMPSHSHGYSSRISTSIGGFNPSVAGSNYTNTSNSSMNTGNVGSSGAHNNMPPYYVLCYIIKL